MDRELCEESFSSSDSQEMPRKRPRDDFDEDLPSSESDTSSYSPTKSDCPMPGSDVGGATSSKGASFQKKDTKGPTDNSSTPQKSRGKAEGDVGPVSLLTVESLNGQFTGEILDFRMPCTATDDTACQIVDHLSTWNEFFCLTSWQLQEKPGSSGKLSLTFFRSSSWRYCSSQLHMATLLACELMKSHRCLSAVELDIYLLEDHLEILSDALRASSSVTSVKLSFCGWINGEDLATAALSLPRLQELVFSGYGEHSPTLVGRLSTLLQTTTSLTALKISKEGPKGLSSDNFFQGLGQNCSLKELVLPSRLVAEASPSAQAAFAEWMTNSISLKSLTVTSLARENLPQQCILGAIRQNRSITRVVFDCPEVDRSDVQLVSKIFYENKVLRSFKMSCKLDLLSTMPSFVPGCPDEADCDRCLKALIENHILEEVSLPFDVFTQGQWLELFEALPTKRNLKKVIIEALRRAPPSVVSKLCVALKETGAGEKVSFSAPFTDREFDEVCTCKAFSTVEMSAGNHNRAAVLGMLERMASLAHITRLYLSFDILVALDGSLSSVLATFLGATGTLETLTLSASWDAFLYDCQEGLLGGLSRNTSLRELRIEVDEARNNFPAFAEPFADLISSSKNITTVHLYGPDSVECAFFQRLSTGVRDNNTLLNVTVLGYRYSEFKRYWFKVWDTTRRNRGWLTGAADFARGARHDRRCALALERMQCHPELVNEMARLEETDKAQAAAMVRDGLRRMGGLHDFMRLAGVVRDQVSCHEREDGRTQLDSLNEHCWSAVRRYLKLRDVRESVAEVL